MSLLKFAEVITYSSEDPNHPVENLLKPDSYLKWKSKAGHNEKQEYVVLKLEKLAQIQSIDIGNEYSAFVEVLVSRESNDYQVLLVASSFMTPLESRSGTTINRVRMFGPDKLNKNIASQKWDRVKIICTQPFNRNTQYGLTFIRVYGAENHDKPHGPNETKIGRFTIKEDEVDKESISVGSLFAQRKKVDNPSSPSLVGPAAIRAASHEIINKNKRQSEESENAPQQPFYQLKKKLKVPDSPSSAPSSKDSSSVKPTLPEPEMDKRATDKKPKENSLLKKLEKEKKVKAPSKSNRPFNQLMKDVVFAMSGYQNPQRAQIRDNLLSMGAKYRSDWGPDCTHLICAFRNTPKFNAVKGKGKIVSEKWSEDSFKKKIRFPWRRYNLEKNRNNDESEEEIWASEICPKTEEKKNGDSGMVCEKLKKDQSNSEPDDSEDTDDEIQRALNDSKRTVEKKKSSDGKDENDLTGEVVQSKISGSESDEYDADTDVDEDLTPPKQMKKKRELPQSATLKSFLKNMTFYLERSLEEEKMTAIMRYIIAYGGEVSDYMSEKVNYVISDGPWDNRFDDALNDNPLLQFVKPLWIWKCCDLQKLVPPQPFLLVPNG